MNTYSIKDLEQLSGVKAHTLRAWEKRYQIIEPMRTETNIRYYDAVALRKLLNICLLQEHGFKISQIAKMSVEDIHKHVDFYTNQEGKFSDKIGSLVLHMMEYNQDGFEEIVNKSIEEYGLEDTIVLVIYPFMQKIGFLWMTEAINPAQEHFISNLIRKKLIVATENLDSPLAKLEPKFILCLPEGEFHESTLLFADYSIKKHGQKAIYLGQNLPFPDLVEVYSIYRTKYIFTAFTLKSVEQSEIYVKRLSEAFPECTVLVAGPKIMEIESKWSNVKLLYAPEELVKYI